MRIQLRGQAVTKYFKRRQKFYSKVHNKRYKEENNTERSTASQKMYQEEDYELDELLIDNLKNHKKDAMLKKFAIRIIEIESLKKAFQYLDQECTGFLTYDQLQEAIQKTKIKNKQTKDVILNKIECKSLFRIYWESRIYKLRKNKLFRIYNSWHIRKIILH